MRPLPAQAIDGAGDVPDDGWLYAFGRPVEHEQARAHHQRAADGKLLLPAGKIAAAPAQRVSQHRNKVEDSGRDVPLRARQDREPGLQVLLDSGSGKISGPWGTKPIPLRARS
jgi:hypothetical protein